MEASDQTDQQGGEDQQQDADTSGLTQEQRQQAEASATQGQQGEGVSGNAIDAGSNFDPNQPVRNAPASPDEVRQAAEAGKLQAPDAAGNRPDGADLEREGATPETGEPSE